MPTKNDINPATGKPYGVNPNTGVWDDNYWSNVVEPKLKAQSGSSGSSTPSASDILGDAKKKLQEQVSFLKDFLVNNPLGYDEVLAREMAQDKYNPYYTEVLSDFVDPLMKKISRSTEDETRLLGELTRQEKLGSKQLTRDTDMAIEAAREGFAGTGLFESGIANRSTSMTGIKGRESLQDFMAKSEETKTEVGLESSRNREDWQTGIAQKQRDIFGTGREYETAVTKDVEDQRSTALKKRGLRAIEAVSSSYGEPLPSISNYLELYNA